MGTGRRQGEILEIVRREMVADVDALAARFGVTPQTIRRDIRHLARQGLLRRHHGGASLPTSVENLDYATRRVLNLEAKRRIAAMASAHIPDRASLFINIGTTTEEVARQLLKRRGLRVITNNLNVAAILGRNPDSEVIVAGGVVRPRDLGITGEATIECIRQFMVDFAVIGISGIDEDGTLRDFDLHEVQVSRTIMRHARRTLLVADRSKFGRHALVRLGHLAQIDILFTDAAPPESMRKIVEDAGVQVITADALDVPAGPAPEPLPLHA